MTRFSRPDKAPEPATDWVQFIAVGAIVVAFAIIVGEALSNGAI